MINEFKTIDKKVESIIVEKKSKFIGEIFHVENEQNANEIINEIKKRYYDAKHVIFAYVIYNREGTIEKYSDDGEPTGTAGKPILEMIKQKELYNVLIVVTRYFGGILLGTGGLLRAYMDCAKECITNSNICKMINCIIVSIVCSYEELEKIKYYCNIEKHLISNIEYYENIDISIAVEEPKYKNFCESIHNLLNRNVDIHIIKNEFVKK